MTAQTVATEGGRIRVPDLPNLGTPQTGDTILGVKDGRTGQFPVSTLGGGSPDLSIYARSSDLQTETEARENADTELKNKIDSLNIPSIAGLAKISDLDTETQAREKADSQLEEKINGLNIPSIAGLATQSSLDSETEAREQGDRTLEDKINGLNIPSIAGLATQGALNDEATARENADSALDKKIDALNIPSTDGLAKNSDLETETQARKNADADLEKKINGLSIPSVDGLAKSADLSQEADERKKADADLGVRIDDLTTKVNAAPAGGGSSGGGITTHYDVPGLTPSGTFEGIIFRRYDGGAGNPGHVDYPADWPKFAIPPAITATSTTISHDDWDAGKMGPGATINITGTSTTGFNFQHPGGWPGSGLESITFWIKGVVA
ncbi:hypothetical protein NQF87_08375 [Bombella sp. TMW 2.2559]|uniref:Tail fiber protein n=1 Tax=Bombella dulcis TaxID=2967339 RepID=A0ABT3WDF3_9PROT|nr:hypothetical protein [Bombella dulcis]MCX5616981.1 hypothetical protein [Bombella dulcis]